ncbi:MAG: FkbM family methyltransferase [Verrucomicrobiota bacterium]
MNRNFSEDEKASIVYAIPYLDANEAATTFFNNVCQADSFDLLDEHADYFRDVALKLEPYNIEAAHCLMSIAAEIRPSGGFIKGKLSNYNAWLDIYHKGYCYIGGKEIFFPSKPPYELLMSFVRGYYEREEVKLLENALEDGDVVLEVGAGIGFMGVNASKMKRLSRYVAYEANPQLIPYIKKNMVQNEVSFEVVNAILFDQETSCKFYVAPDFWVSSLIQPNTNNYEVIDVRAVNKNAVISEISPSLLIVDIEGGEIDFFKDLNLSSVKKILLEIHPFVLSNRDLTKLYYDFFEYGFEIDFMSSFKNVVLFNKVL